jgi:hypothetical protein
MISDVVLGSDELFLEKVGIGSSYTGTEIEGDSVAITAFATMYLATALM